MDDDLFPTRLETDRLTLRPLGRETVDVLDYYEVLSGDPGIEAVARFTPWEPHGTPKETRDYLASVEERRADGENAEWVLFPAAADGFAGVVGLSPHWDRRVGELGVWLRKGYWGEGYASEALDEVTRVAFERLDLELVSAGVRPENDASRRTFDRFVDRHGGRLDGTLRNGWLDQDGSVHDRCRYTVAREEWAEGR